MYSPAPPTHAHTPSSDSVVDLYHFSFKRNIYAEDGLFLGFSESRYPDLPFAWRNYSSVFILSHDTHLNPQDDLFDMTISATKPKLPSLFHQDIV